MKLKKLFNFKLWTILTSVFAVLMIVFIVGTHIAVTYGSAAINMIFGTSTTKTIGTTEQMRFESDWADTNGSGLFIEDKIMTRKAAAEGAVLLWNKEISAGQKALPIAKDSAVSLFSHSSVDYIESGTGSGHIDTVTQNGKKAKTTLKSAMERHYSVNTDLWRFYEIGGGSRYTRDTGWGSTRKQWYLHEVPWSEYTKAGVTSSFASYGDAAIIIISRTGGENGDLHFSQETATEDGGYLALTQEEKDMLQNVCEYRKNGTFKRAVVVFNTGNVIQMQDFEPYIENLDAALWCGQGGTTGVNAVAELLVGNESPSGRLSDTLAYDVFSQPATENDDIFAYENYSNSSAWYNSYMVYQEGIYVGYKYYETRYTDGIINPTETGALTEKGAKHSEGAWSYDSEVAFPFGYGASYSEFSYSSFNVEYDKENKQYVVSVDVKNTGSTAAKEVVQVYLSKPYTDHDKQNNIEVSAVELVGFGKTAKLPANGRETVKVNIPEDYFKTYDATFDNGDGTFGRYVVEAGDYYLTVATDSHVAANNVIAARTGNPPPAQKIMVGEPRKVSLGADFVKKLTLERDATTYAVSRQTGEKVYNKLDCGDINKYEGRGDNSVTYLSRKDWDGTYPTPAKITITDKMKNDLAISFVSPKAATADKPMPTYGKFVSGAKDGKPDVENGDLVVFDFIDAPLNEYDENWSEEWEAKWNQLLDQMTWYEQANICANAYHQLVGATSIALPASRQENGPVGITKRSESNWQIPNQDVKDWTYIAYPNAPVLASTFNTEIVEQVGQHMSEDMLYLGYNGIYGPGGNIHRTPFGGRNWEYYSEDAVLSGIIGAAQCKGIESKGCLAYVKHFAFNDSETNRHHCGIWSNEQASREIYLRAFEIIFTDGEASATMNSFTRVGTTWNGMSKELQTDILRKEWGWDGINITDWIESDVMSKPDAIFAGTNSFDGNGKPETYFKGWDNDADFAWKLRESAKIIIYNVARTHTFNGISRNSIVINVTPWWQATLYAFIGVFTFLTVAAGAMLTLSIVFKQKFAEIDAKREAAKAGASSGGGEADASETTAESVEAGESESASADGETGKTE